MGQPDHGIDAGKAQQDFLANASGYWTTLLSGRSRKIGYILIGIKTAPTRSSELANCILSRINAALRPGTSSGRSCNWYCRCIPTASCKFCGARKYSAKWCKVAEMSTTNTCHHFELPEKPC